MNSFYSRYILHMWIISENVMPAINVTTRNQEYGDIIVTIVTIIWMLYCICFKTERHIYLPFVTILTFHPLPL